MKSIDKIIVITDDNILPEEPQVWVDILEEGINKIHVRKPKATVDELRNLLFKIPDKWKGNIVINSFTDLAYKFNLSGAHLPYKDYLFKKALFNHNLPISCSTHSWKEVNDVIETCTYCFISPVFDSISKSGYNANYELKTVPDNLKNKKIYALGGVNQENISKALDMGYYGVAVKGYIWKDPNAAVEKIKELIKIVNFNL